MQGPANLILPAGSDFRHVFTWPDGAGGAADLSGFSSEVFGASTALVGAVAFDILDGPAGQVALAITWQDGWTAGEVGRFRLRLREGAEVRASSGEIAVVVGGRAFTLGLNRGASFTGELTWPEDGGPATLAAQVVDILTSSPALAGRVSAAIVDAAARRVRFTVQGDDAWPRGEIGRFQLRRHSSGAERRTLPAMVVVIE